MNHYFYLEPYTFVYFSSGRVTIINTINNKIFIYDNSLILKLCKRLIDKKNMYVIKINDNIYKSSDFKSFLFDIRKSFSGDLISSFSNKPIQFAPIILNKLEESLKDKSPEMVMSNLKEISIYINSDCEKGCGNCHSYYKQFSFCTTQKSNSQLSIEKLNYILKEVEFEKLMRINILGGDILKYKWLNRLNEILTKSKTEIFYYINILNIIETNSINSLINLLHNKNSYIIILISDFSLHTLNFIQQIWESLNSYNIQYHIVLENEKQLDIVQNEIEKFDYLLIPFYNGNNLSFFKEFVFTDKKDILENKYKLSDLLSKKYINMIEFGKLTVLSDGSVYGNINTKSIGNILETQIDSIVYKELLKGESWRKRRQYQKPCKTCQYNLLCPPISNYERIIGQNNLCQFNHQ